MKWYRWTIGEVLVIVLSIAGVVGAFYHIGLGHTKALVEMDGSVAQIPLALTFGTVSHNSIWTFLLGIPFERALSFHKFFAFLSVLCGLWHGYHAYLIHNVRSPVWLWCWCRSLAGQELTSPVPRLPTWSRRLRSNSRRSRRA